MKFWIFPKTLVVWYQGPSQRSNLKAVEVYRTQLFGKMLLVHPTLRRVLNDCFEFRNCVKVFSMAWLILKRISTQSMFSALRLRPAHSTRKFLKSRCPTQNLSTSAIRVISHMLETIVQRSTAQSNPQYALLLNPINLAQRRQNFKTPEDSRTRLSDHFSHKNIDLFQF